MEVHSELSQAQSLGYHHRMRQRLPKRTSLVKAEMVGHSAFCCSCHRHVYHSFNSRWKTTTEDTSPSTLHCLRWSHQLGVCIDRVHVYHCVKWSKCSLVFCCSCKTFSRNNKRRILQLRGSSTLDSDVDHLSWHCRDLCPLQQSGRKVHVWFDADAGRSHTPTVSVRCKHYPDVDVHWLRSQGTRKSKQ